MQTMTHRVSVSFTPDISAALGDRARMRKTPLAQTVREIVTETVEREEDEYFGRLAEERMKSDTEYLTHEEAWAQP